MNQYLFCVKCKIAKDRMVVYSGFSYCLDCCKIKDSILTPKEEEAMKKRDDEAMEGLSELFK